MGDRLLTATLGGGESLGATLGALGWVLVSGVVTAALWAVGRPMVSRPPLLTTNYRGHELPTAAGVFVVLGPLFTTSAAHVLAVVPGVPDGPMRGVGTLGFAVAVALPLCLLGLLDDLLGAGQSGGFAGHLRAAARGELTTGLLKLVGGGLVGLLAATSVIGSEAGWAALGRVVLWGAAVALWANVGNLFDRAPGRTIKVGTTATLVIAAIAAVTGDVPVPVLCGPLALVAAAVAMAPADLSERCMLGDSGSNVVGAAVALEGLVAWPSSWVPGLVLLLIGLCANLASERVSFSRVIEQYSLLSALDRAGAPHRRSARSDAGSPPAD